MSWLIRARTLLLGIYTELPTLLVAGTLLLGGITGLLPMIIVGLCCALVWITIYGIQFLFKGLFGLEHDKIILTRLSSLQSNDVVLSKWIGVLMFLSTYVLSNAIAIYNLPASTSDNQQLIDNRKAYMISCMIAVVLICVILFIMRWKASNEKWWMWMFSLGVGGSAGLALWNAVTKNGSDLRWGDLFQVRSNLAPASLSTSDGSMKPVICTT
jgi:hypothetical protein